MTNSPGGWPRRLAIAATRIACVGVVAVLLVALVPVWPCVLFEHFRVQYVCGGVIVVALAAALRMGGYFDAVAISTLLHLLWILPDLGSGARPLPANGVRVRVLVINVHTSSSAFDQVRSLIDDLRPDVLGLVEVDDRWLRGLAPAVAHFTGRLEHPRNDNFGVALYTREGLVGSVEELEGSLPVALGSVSVGGAGLSLMVMHPLPPVSDAALTGQRNLLDAVAARARSTAGPLVVMGDFNATPWSRPFRRFLERSGLCDSRAGFGLQATFPATSAVLRIPIDHALVTCAIGVADRRVERDVGSDHLPVVVDLVVPRAGQR